MTGPQHYVAAEQLLEHAAAMLDTDVDPSRATELVQRQIAVATLGRAHACSRPGSAPAWDRSTPRNGGMLRPCGQSEHLAALAADLRQYVAMADRYRTASGWSVEVVERSGTPDNSDGQQLRVRYHGFYIADVRTVAELEQWFSLADLEPDGFWPTLSQTG